MTNVYIYLYLKDYYNKLVIVILLINLNKY